MSYSSPDNLFRFNGVSIPQDKDRDEVINELFLNFAAKDPTFAIILVHAYEQIVKKAVIFEFFEENPHAIFGLGEV